MVPSEEADAVAGNKSTFIQKARFNSKYISNICSLMNYLIQDFFLVSKFNENCIICENLDDFCTVCNKNSKCAICGKCDYCYKKNYIRSFNYYKQLNDCVDVFKTKSILEEVPLKIFINNDNDRYYSVMVNNNIDYFNSIVFNMIYHIYNKNNKNIEIHINLKQSTISTDFSNISKSFEILEVHNPIYFKNSMNSKIYSFQEYSHIKNINENYDKYVHLNHAYILSKKLGSDFFFIEVNEGGTKYSFKIKNFVMSSNMGNEKKSVSKFVFKKSTTKRSKNTYLLNSKKKTNEVEKSINSKKFKVYSKQNSKDDINLNVLIPKFKDNKFFSKIKNNLKDVSNNSERKESKSKSIIQTFNSNSSSNDEGKLDGAVELTEFKIVNEEEDKGILNQVEPKKNDNTEDFSLKADIKESSDSINLMVKSDDKKKVKFAIDLKENSLSNQSNPKNKPNFFDENDSIDDSSICDKDEGKIESVRDSMVSERNTSLLKKNKIKEIMKSQANIQVKVNLDKFNADNEKDANNKDKTNLLEVNQGQQKYNSFLKGKFLFNAI
jgi:hypothetical protein